MHTDRREFLKLASGGVVAAGLATPLAAVPSAVPRPAAAQVAPARRALQILILGGTGFMGPAQVRYAVARGHRVTVFNRGRRQADLPDSVEQLTGDREVGDLRALEGRRWDVAIDNPTTLPFWVRDVGRVLQGNVGQYVFISTLSVYASNAEPGADEAAVTLPHEGDPLEVRQPSGQLYGPMKAASEREAERWFPGRTTIIRPGLIVGPRDESDRFTYWPVRIERGGEVLAPGSPTDPAQLIDARDLAEWTIRMVETGTTGVFNATGPLGLLTLGEMLGGIRGALDGNADVRLTWVAAEFLQAQRVRAWSDMPVWIPPVGQTAGFMMRSNARAVAQGLTFRPLAETVRDTLAWHHTRPEERKGRLAAGVGAEREAEVLSAWRAARGGL